MALRGNRNQGSASLSSVSSLTPVALSAVPTVQILEVNDSQTLRTIPARIKFQWDRAMDDFTLDDVRLTFIDENELTGDIDNFSGGDGVSTYFANLNLPANSEGTVDITVIADAAEDSTDNTRIGPQEEVTVSFPYNTLELSVTYPEVSIDDPAQVPWRDSNLPIVFRWTEAVAGFTLADDVRVLVNGTENNAIISNLRDISTQRDWQADIAVPANTSGMITVIVAMDSVHGVQARGPQMEYRKDIAISATVDTAITNSATILEETMSYTDLDGAYCGVLESIALSGFVYLLVQIVHATETSTENPNSLLRWDLRGRAELVQIELSSGTKTVLATYLDVLTAPRSLHIFDNKLRFFRGSHYAYEYPARVYEDGEVAVEGYLVDSEMTPDWRSEVGGLWELDGTTLTKVGSFGRPIERDPDAELDAPDNPHYGILGGMASPIVSMTNPNDATKTDVIGVAGYGSLSEIGDNLIANKEADRLDNWYLTAITESVEGRVPVLETNGQPGWSSLNAIAKMTRSRVGFRGEQVHVEPAVPRTGLIKTAISDSDTTLELKDLTHETIPSTGTVFVEGELIDYTGVMGETLTGLQRGAYETTADGHLVDAVVVFVDHQVDEFLSLSLDNATSQVYNAIVLEYADGHERAPEEDAASITAYGRHELRISTLLSRLQTAWADDLAKAYLSQFKDPEVLVNATVAMDTEIHIGEVVFVDQVDRAHLFGCGEVVAVRNVVARGGDGFSQTTVLKLRMV